MPIPEFREDGYLPEGLHLATEPEVLFRFGSSGRRRRNLALRLRRWLALARAVGALRFAVNGSFVTSKLMPGDVDAVIWLPSDFQEQVDANNEEAVDLDAIVTGQPAEHLFGAQTAEDWSGWVEFFGRTREPDGRRKGIVEVGL